MVSVAHLTREWRARGLGARFSTGESMTNESRAQLYFSHSHEERFQKIAMNKSTQADINAASLSWGPATAACKTFLARPGVAALSQDFRRGVGRMERLPHISVPPPLSLNCAIGWDRCFGLLRLRRVIMNHHVVNYSIIRARFATCKGRLSTALSPPRYSWLKLGCIGGDLAHNRARILPYSRSARRGKPSF
jgi:hypothetical protein